MNQKILFKLPSRSRPNRLFEVLDLTYEKLVNKEDFLFLLTLDSDDSTMNNPDVLDRINSYKNMNYIFDFSDSKISAVNRDLDEFDKSWDILVLLSDDMYPIINGFDNILRINFMQYFPDFDGVLWFNDGYKKSELNTLCILGKKYYDRFGYIYHPSYKSLYCDNEFTEVAKQLNKQKYFSDVIIEHKHYSNGDNSQYYDELYKINEKYFLEDKTNFNNRKKTNFDLDNGKNTK